MEDEARALNHVQAVLGWYTTTEGEPAIFADTYKGHEHLFSKASIDVVAAALKDPSLSADDQRRLQFLRDYLATQAIELTISHYDDEEQNAELTATATLSFSKDPVPYKQLDVLGSNDADPAHRAEIDAAKQKIRRETLNPILQAKEKEAEQLAKQIGYRDYLELSSDLRLVDLHALLVKGAAYKANTDSTYHTLLAERTKAVLGKDVKDLHAADMGRLLKAPEFDKFFPKELTVPTFEYFLSGIGLTLNGVNGQPIRIDDEPRPEKDPRAVTYNIVTPDDIRFSLKPIGGIEDYDTAFHEGGHAEHFANTTTPVLEFQELGNNGVTESYAEFFAHSWDDPVWLRRYRDFVGKWNKDHGTSYPTMTDDDITAFVRTKVFMRMLMLRRYAWAKLIYEPLLHGGDPQSVSDVWKGAVSPPLEVYRQVFGESYGYDMTEDEAQRYLTDVDDFLYAADYARAFVLSDMMQEAMRTKFGDDWYGNSAVGALLKQSLFAKGNELQPDEVAKILGYPDGLDFSVVEARQNRLLGLGQPASAPAH
jgi:hypothetical protein